MPASAASTDRSPPARGARAAVAGVLLCVLYAPVIATLTAQWLRDPNYQHGLAVPLVSAYLLWRMRARLRAAPFEPAGGWSVAALAVASAFLVAGTAASELFTARLSLPIMIIGVLLVLRGKRFVRIAAGPLLFLLLMIPLPYLLYYKLTFPMQLMSARLAAGALGGIGVEVIRQGNILRLPNYTLEVVAACSGLRSLMTLVTLSLILCAFSGLGTGRRIVLALSSIPIAVAANTFRLAVTAVGAQAVGPSFADGILHEISGLIVFLAGFVLLLAVWGVLKWTSPDGRRSPR